jgi:hypothetical protein
MHNLEPHYNWQHYYNAQDDALSPFYDRIYSEFEYTNHIYNFVIHPQWDDMGSETLYLKILYVDYDKKCAIIELIGEWNDAISNDIMILKRDVIDQLQQHEIDKYIVIGENVLNFHPSDDAYYEEWLDDVNDGWIAFVNFRPHVIAEMNTANIDSYINIGGKLNNIDWRTYPPIQFYNVVSKIIGNRLN